MGRKILFIGLILVVLGLASTVVYGSQELAAEFDAKEGTIEMWIQPNWDFLSEEEVDRGHQILFYWGPIEWYNELRFFIWGKHIIAPRWMNTGTVMAPDPEVTLEGWTAGQWHHVAVTWDAAESYCYIFINGELAGSVPEWEPPDGSIDYTIGMHMDGRHPFDGTIEGAKLFGHAKTAAEIKAAFLAPPEAVEH